MKNVIRITSMVCFVLLLNSCKSYHIDTTPKSDLVKNTEELQKKQELEREKKEINIHNNFGKPISK